MKNNHWFSCFLENILNKNRTLKVSILLFICVLFNLHASSYSQNTKVTVSVNNAPIEMVLGQIESQSKFKFFYKTGEVDVNKKVTINVKNISIKDLLHKIFVGDNISFVTVKNQIVLKSNRPAQPVFSGKPPMADREQPAPQISISGTIVDSNGVPILGASVIEKGTTNGTAADFDGNYVLQVSGPDAVLVFSSLGFSTQELTVGTATTLNVTLQEDAQSLDEVVIVGYGTQRKSDLTGAISSVSSDDVQGQPVANINEAVQGRIPGVEITSSSGEPGAPLQIRVRGMGTFGNTGPLYVVDGMPVNVTDVNSIDPNSIESMDILKDASASAIYGSRAANGVVLITTKAGKSGKPKVTIDSYYGIQEFTNFIPMLNSRQYAQLNIDASAAAGATVEPAFANPDGITVNTDWQKAAYQAAPIQNYNVSISGGSENAKYSVSGGYFDQEGIMVFSNFKRYTARVKSEFKIGEKLTIGESINLSRGLGLNMGQGNNLDFAYLLGASPTMPIFREGNLGGYAGPNAAETGRNNRENIVGRRNFRRTYTTINKILGSLYAEYQIIPNLKYRLNLGINAGFNTSKLYVPKFEMENRTNLVQQLTESKNESYEYLVENILTYDKQFEDFSLSLLGGYTEQNAFYSNIGGSIREFPSNELRVIDAGTGSFTLQGNESEWALRSYLGRANITVLDKYLFTATFRRDGSSRFGSENRYGNFPSVALGWNISRENFMSAIPAISNLKLRGSWGKLGNQDTNDNYVNQTTIDTTPRYILGSGQGIAAAAAVTSLGNPALKWESTTQTNVGVDLGLLDGSIFFTADYWVKDTDGVLLRTPISVATGIDRSSGPYENSAGIKNSGFEFLLGYRKDREDFNYEVSVNLSTVKNEVTSLGDGTASIINLVNNAYNYGTFTRTTVGESMSSFYGYVADGIFQNDQEVASHATQPGAAPGDVRFKDLNGDGAITDADRKVIGDPFPDFSYGINGNMSYKNFDLSLSFQGIAGKELYNSQRAYLESMDGEHGQMATTLNRWTSEGSTNTFPRAVRGNPNDNTRPSTRFLENASFLKLRNIQVGYRFPKSILDSVGLTNARIYLSAQNVFTITDYSGYNPDVLGGSGWATNDLNPLAVGVDTGTYPLPRTIQMGVQIGL